MLPSDRAREALWRVESSSHRSVSFWSVRSAATRRPSGDSLRFDRPAAPEIRGAERVTRPVEPREPRHGRPSRPVGHHSCVRCRKRTGAGDGLERDGVRNGDRLAADRPSCEIEALREERSLTHEQQPARCHVCALRVGRQETRHLRRLERAQIHAAHGVRAADEEQELPAPWQELRMAVAGRLRRGVVAASTVPPAALTRRSAGAGVLEKRMVPSGPHARRRPGQRVGHCLHRAAPGLDASQLAVREEPDRAAVGRPEWPARPSVPGNACAPAASRARTHSVGCPSWSATYASRRPSGETAKDHRSDVRGVVISTTRRSGVIRGRPHEPGHRAPRPTPAPARRSRCQAALAAATRRRSPEPRRFASGSLAVSSISIRASAMWWRRRRGSRSRHRRSIRRMGRQARRQAFPVGLVLQNGRQRFGRGRATERLARRQHLVHHAAEGPHVAAPVDAAATRLFRTHVRLPASRHRTPPRRR